MKSDNFVIGLLLLILTAFISFGIHYTRSYFEARAFNAVTGRNVSAWDAMFIELRVNDIGIAPVNSQ